MFYGQIIVLWTNPALILEVLLLAVTALKQSAPPVLKAALTANLIGRGQQEMRAWK